jgi:hypothetical protein
LGAFALKAGSADASLLLELPPGQYTAIARGVNNSTGIAIVELYDTETTGQLTTASKLVNISNRGYVGTGDEIMIPGFVISSEGPKTLLVRAVGPTLANFNVSGTMADPKLTVYRTEAGNKSTPLLTQDNWSENPDATYTAQVAEQVGAFPLAPASKDAAFVITLPPGIYTMHGKSADGLGTGVALVEVYVVE